MLNTTRRTFLNLNSRRKAIFPCEENGDNCDLLKALMCLLSGIEMIERTPHIPISKSQAFEDKRLEKPELIKPLSCLLQFDNLISTDKSASLINAYR